MLDSESEGLFVAANLNIGEIEARCWEIQNSPYLRKEPPKELQKLRSLLGKVDKLSSEDVPTLVAEIKRLRAQNKRLVGANAALEDERLEADEQALGVAALENAVTR
jgi:ABC-type phosphate transport system auxiliary subunit